jgi:hypothetical protein
VTGLLAVVTLLEMVALVLLVVALMMVMVALVLLVVALVLLVVALVMVMVALVMVMVALVMVMEVLVLQALLHVPAQVMGLMALQQVVALAMATRPCLQQALMKPTCWLALVMLVMQ